MSTNEILKYYHDILFNKKSVINLFSDKSGGEEGELNVGARKRLQIFLLN